MARARTREQQMDFRQLFTSPDWASTLRAHISTPEGMRQFNAFVRSDAFMEAMRNASLTPEGQRNIVAALQEESTRGALLRNFDSYRVRWAIGDLFNSPQGRQIMNQLLFSDGLPSLSSLAAVRDIVRTMVTTTLPESEIIRDFNHFRIPEQTIHATDGDLRWFRDAISTDARTESFLRELGTGQGISRVVNLLRTQEARGLFNDIMRTRGGRQRIARLLGSLEGLVALRVAMKTPEGMNMVGFLWNMPNGKQMIRDGMLNIRGMNALYQIFRFQQDFHAEQERRQGIMGTRPRRGR
jgi:hypothetical protein